MSFSDNLKNKYFAIIDFILLLIFGVIHLVFYFIIKETDFENIFDIILLKGIILGKGI